MIKLHDNMVNMCWIHEGSEDRQEENWQFVLGHQVSNSAIMWNIILNLTRKMFPGQMLTLLLKELCHCTFAVFQPELLEE